MDPQSVLGAIFVFLVSVYLFKRSIDQLDVLNLSTIEALKNTVVLNVDQFCFVAAMFLFLLEAASPHVTPM